MNLTNKAHQLVRQHVKEHHLSDLAIDATCGNGHDTLFLCQLGFTKVLGFDIQTTAIENTEIRCHKFLNQSLSLIKDGHENINLYTQQNIDIIMFNFGYLPKADKQKTTLIDTSLQALKFALKQLKPNGLITLLCYPGHKAGKIETQAIQSYLAALSSNWQYEPYLSTAPSESAPILYCIQRAENHPP